MKPFLLLLAGSLLSLSTALAQPTNLRTENVILITFDGLRWQELFGGADSALLNSEFTKDKEGMKARFWSDNPQQRRAKLFPNLWNLVEQHGQLFGNRWKQNFVNTTNIMHFSYPGYNEILTGSEDDDHIQSNAKVPNRNITVLEFLNKQPRFAGKVAAFGSWDVFPYIENHPRSGVYVNAGYMPTTDEPLTEREKLLNELQETLPREWESVRFDALTYQLAKEYMKKHQPSVLFLSLGETDDYAHDSRYDHYLQSAHASDKLIRDLWDYLQSTEKYAGKTSIVLTTDHGRGDLNKKDWTGHGSRIRESNQIWIGVIGPDTEVLGEVKAPGQRYQNQVAQTVAQLLGTTFVGSRPAGEAVKEAIGKTKR